MAPPQFAAAVAAGVQDALTDTFNEQLREMRESGVADSAGDVRVMVRELRDQERAPEGAPQAPDIVSLSQKNVRDTRFIQKKNYFTVHEAALPFSDINITIREYASPKSMWLPQ